MNLDELKEKLAEKHARSYDPTNVYTNLPPALEFTKDDFHAGFGAAIKLCQENAGEPFDEAEVAEELHGLLNEGDISRWDQLTLAKHFARWQHAQLSATIGALREDRANQNVVIQKYKDANSELHTQLAERDKEIERLKAVNAIPCLHGDLKEMLCAAEEKLAERDIQLQKYADLIVKLDAKLLAATAKGGV